MSAAKGHMKRGRGEEVVPDADELDSDAPLLSQVCLPPHDAEVSTQQRQRKRKQEQQKKTVCGSTRVAHTGHETSFSDLAEDTRRECGEEKKFLFDKSVRNAMRPSVTSQFKLMWCWPASSTNQLDVVCERGPRNVGPTSIVELRGEPFLREENRRVAVVVNCGERFLLPLLPRPREGSTEQENGVFWSTSTRPNQDLPPSFAELLVGTVQDLERASNIVQNSPSSFHTQADGAGICDGTSAKEEEVDSAGSLRTFFFRSLPYRTLWLHQFSKCLIISLPCEERLISLNLGRSTHSTEVFPKLVMKSIECTGSFLLPSFMVPLDISEVYHRPFLAVGTMCHGVLVVLLEKGMCASVVHRLPLSGLSTSMFPVTHICAVFPPLRCENDKSGGLGVWGAKSAFLSQCLEGAILCASPYENRTVVAKCSSAGGEGCGFEPPPPTRTVARFLCSTPYSSPEFGPIIATLDGRLLHFGVDDTKLSETEGSPTKSQRKDCRQRYGAFDLVSPEVFYVNTMRVLLGVTPNHFCEGGPVRQKVSHSSYQASFDRHWLCLTGISHQVILLDRRAANYVKHSAITLTVPKSPSFVATASTLESRPPEVSNKKQKNVSFCEGNGAQEISGDDSVYPTAIEDGISGISWVRVTDGMLQLVAAHHQNWLTVVTWEV
ncbi:hypothetical protein, conserved [Trypanosoma cruzi]|uniref:Uncharacterized protein n=1 Tax=Trypanosoma cruzi (strain CL Brener) TaxID=353153 RepID=Q4DHW1_TRYCC|nr:hypothetical protein, conserved [Trypanosoma cruzi]EAN92113.1 hypothetical protein, conserved [Trypanosoma cruzi]|eukprot:XP_813964.1 hypothetical protein [Trypanosoma cruzi strain CL Brener]